MLSRLPVPLLGLLLLAGCATGPARDVCGLEPAGTATLRSEAGWVLGDVAGRGARATMLVDTGNAASVLREPAARRLGLATGPAVPMQGVTFGTLPLDAATIAVRPDIDARVGVATNGLLGVDLLGRYAVDLDIPNGQARFFSGIRCAEDPSPDGAAPAGGPPLPPATGATAPFRTRISINGHPGIAIADTGAQRSTLFVDAADGFGITPQMLAKDRHIVVRGANGAQVRAPRHRIAEIRLGTTVLRDIELLVVPRSVQIDAQMILGLDLLSSSRVWLDPAWRDPRPASP